MKISHRHSLPPKPRLARILTAAAILTLCGGWLRAEPPVKVGASFPGGTSRWPIEAAAMKAAASDAGVDLTVDQSLMASSAQIDYFKARVSGGDKVILVTAIDSRDANWPAALKAAKDAGVAVIAYDRGLPGANLYYSFDNREIGRIQGSWLVDKVPSGSYYILRGASSDPNSALFADGALEAIRAASQVTVLNPLEIDQTVTGWNPSNAKIMVSWILRSEVPAAILAPNDGTAEGAFYAISSSSIPASAKASLMGTLTGQDGQLAALRRIYFNQQGMTVVKDIKSLAKYAISLAASLARGGSVAATGRVDGTAALLVTPAIDPGAVFAVDRANIQALAEAGSLGFSWAQITAP